VTIGDGGAPRLTKGLKMYRLYWRTGSGSLVAEAALRMAEQAFAGVAVDSKASQREAAFLALNPAGKIPVLAMPDGQPVFESLAILLTLDERHPEARLLPPSGTTDWRVALQWLVFLAAQAYPSALRYWYPNRHTMETSDAAIAAVKAQGAADLRRDLALFADAMRGPFLLGETLTITDVYAAMIADWEEPAFTDARLAELRTALLGNDAIRAAWENHAFST
jgi:glutathione S-transferase